MSFPCWVVTVYWEGCAENGQPEQDTLQEDRPLVVRARARHLVSVSMQRSCSLIVGTGELGEVCYLGRVCEQRDGGWLLGFLLPHCLSEAPLCSSFPLDSKWVLETPSAATIPHVWLWRRLWGTLTSCLPKVTCSFQPPPPAPWGEHVTEPVPHSKSMARRLK